MKHNIQTGKFYKQGNWYHKIAEVTPDKIESVAFCSSSELYILSFNHRLLKYGQEAQEITEDEFYRTLFRVQKSLNQAIIQI